MAYPTKLTDEEQALVEKYAMLKKKKRLNSNLKTSSNESKEVKAVAPKKETNTKELSKPKDAKEAMEKAKQLLASGQLKLNKGAGSRPFKRARSSTIDRKPKDSIEPKATSQQSEKIENVRRDSYNNFVSSNENDNDQQPSHSSPTKKQFDHNRRPGQRKLFISGYNLTKAIMDKAFKGHRPIKSSYFDQDKGVGYVDFVTPEGAEKAITDLHGSQVDGCILKVVFARRQPYRVDDNRFTTRHNNVRPDDRNNRFNSGGDRRHRGPRRDSGARSSDESPVKHREDITKKRKLVTYTEPEEFDF